MNKKVNYKFESQPKIDFMKNKMTQIYQTFLSLDTFLIST